MPRLDVKAPAYLRHSASGQARVRIGGRDIYLGPFGTAASKREYDRVIAEWLANGRQASAPGTDLFVAELCAAFRKHAQTYYRKPDGTPTSEASNFDDAMRPLIRLYGRTRVADFGPLALKAVREEMIRGGLVRTSINRHTSRLKHIFKWAAENEMIPAGVFEAIHTVSGLRLGRSEAKESEPVRPVPEAHVEATLHHLYAPVAAMVRLQLLTGMRPGEVCSVRGMDLDTTGRLWTYTPGTHKTAHHGHARILYLGPRAQEVVRPFLRPVLGEYLFSPADAEKARREAMALARKTPMSCGNRPGTNRKQRPMKTAGPRYVPEAYAAAIYRATDKADQWAKGGAVIGDGERIIPRWHPHQLRHNAATWLRKEYGLEAAQVILGHKTLTVTQVYAEKNVAAAQRIMAEVG